MFNTFFKQSYKVMAFNLAAGLFMAWAAMTFVRDQLFPLSPTPCSARMDESVSLGLAHNGRLLQAADFQAIANGMDFGVIDNLSVVRVRGGPAPIVMDVFLKAGSAQQNAPEADSGGMSLPWTPRSLKPNLTHGCLAYSVFFPETFEFGDAGTLPGFRGASKALGAIHDERFATHVVWGKNGNARHHTFAADNEVKSKAMTGGMPKPVVIPQGRWVRIEHELRLNDVGSANGLSRLWVDGTFVSERKDAVLRFSPDSFITAVGIDVFFGGQGDEIDRGRAAKDERIMISPVEVRWP